MRPELFVVLADFALAAVGGALATTAPEGFAQHIGLCAIGSCCGGVIGLSMSYPGLKAKRVGSMEMAIRSLANFMGGIPGGYAATFWLEPYFPEIPREGMFMISAMVCGVFLVGLFMVAQKVLKSAAARLDGRSLAEWILRLPPQSPPPNPAPKAAPTVKISPPGS